MAVVYVLMYFKCKICFTVYTGETLLTYALYLPVRQIVVCGNSAQVYGLKVSNLIFKVFDF